jgi:hypothetical protein
LKINKEEKKNVKYGKNKNGIWEIKKINLDQIYWRNNLRKKIG